MAYSTSVSICLFSVSLISYSRCSPAFNKLAMFFPVFLTPFIFSLFGVISQTVAGRFCLSGAGCSKLTTSLVNVSLKL